MSLFKLFIKGLVIFSLYSDVLIAYEVQVGLSELKSETMLAPNFKLSHGISWDLPKLTFGFGYEVFWEPSYYILKIFTGPEMYVDTKTVGSSYGYFLDFGAYRKIDKLKSVGMCLSFASDDQYQIDWQPTLALRFKHD